MRLRPCQGGRDLRDGWTKAFAISFALIAGCAARTFRQQDIRFFPGPAGPGVQEAARDAVLKVFNLHRIVVLDADPGAEVLGFKVVECDDHPRVAYFQFAPSRDEQTVRVWTCADPREDCSTVRHDRSVPAQCAQPVNRLVSSMESDLMERLLARTTIHVTPAAATRWWDHLSLESLLSLFSVRRDQRPSLSDEWRLSALAMAGSSRARRPVVRRAPSSRTPAPRGW